MTRLVVVRAPGAACAVSASELVAIDREDGARITVDGTIHDLAAAMATPEDPCSPALRMIIELAGRRHAVRVRGEVELVDTSAVYRLPSLLRAAGCAPWLVGLVVLDQPLPWIDLSRLARTAKEIS